MKQSLWRAVRLASVALVAALATGAGAGSALGASLGFGVGPISDMSASCAGQNAEVEQAVDPTRGYVYEDWMGCKGIGFARSSDGGRTFSAPLTLPGSSPSLRKAPWDPSVTVAPDGTVYAAFMVTHGNQAYPVVAASFDHGETFPQVSSLVPPDAQNWGDRDFIAVGPDGTVYLTYDYGPTAVF